MKIDQITSIFQCLMDTTRLRAVKLLINAAEYDVREVCVGDFVLSLVEPQYNISKQLKILELACVLTSRKQGRNVYFSLARGSLVDRLFVLIEELPDSEHVFVKDFKNLNAVLESEEESRGSKVRVKIRDQYAEVKSPVVSPPRELQEMDLPSNLL